MTDQEIVKVEARYFFWNDKPYRKLSESRSRNKVYAWDIEEDKKVMFTWLEWKRHHEKAFRTGQAAQIIGRHYSRLLKYLSDGAIPAPYRYIGDADGQPGYPHLRYKDFYLWRQEDLMNVVDYMEELKPRGGEKFWKRPEATRGKVIAQINDNDVVQFIRDDDGNFIPLYKAT